MSKAIDFIEQDSDFNQSTCQGLLSLDLYQNTVNTFMSLGNTLSEQAIFVQERGGDALDDLATNINRYLRPAPTSTVAQGVQSVSDRLEDVSTSIHRSVRDLKHLF